MFCTLTIKSATDQWTQARPRAVAWAALDQALCVVSLVYDDVAKLLELAPSKVAFDLDAGKDYLLDVIVD